MLPLSALVVVLAITAVSAQSNLIQSSGSDGCSSEESSEEENRVVEECATEVQTAIFHGFDKTLHHGMVPATADGLRRKRDADIPPVMRRSAGCVLQCVFRKYDVLGSDNLPTRQGLMNMATDGIADRRYFMAVTHIIDRCYNFVREFKHKTKAQQATPGEYCDLAFDAFNCFEDGLEEFCEQN